MSSGLEIPGQTTINYVVHSLNSAMMLNTTVPNGPKGPEIHIAGGYTRLENVAIELAKSACQGCANDESDQAGVDPAAFGVWAARSAAALLAECGAIEEEIKRNVENLRRPSLEAVPRILQ